jgi:hypothetical protein
MAQGHRIIPRSDYRRFMPIKFKQDGLRPKPAAR